jgi:hypothetical protein
MAPYMYPAVSYRYPTAPYTYTAVFVYAYDGSVYAYKVFVFFRPHPQPLSHSVGEGYTGDSPVSLQRGRGACRELKGVGFFSRGWHGGRDARVPSAARAGSASVSLAWR